MQHIVSELKEQIDTVPKFFRDQDKDQENPKRCCKIYKNFNKFWFRNTTSAIKNSNKFMNVKKLINILQQPIISRTQSNKRNITLPIRSLYSYIHSI